MLGDKGIYLHTATHSRRRIPGYGETNRLLVHGFPRMLNMRTTGYRDIK